MLHELNITVSKETKAGKIFESLAPDFLSISYNTPKDYVRILWKRYQRCGVSNNNLNGIIFEIILATLCIRENLLPLFMGAKVAFVPNVDYDLMLYSPECGPICLSAKTSLRERYKQADLEAIALKFVHRKAQSYLITLHEQEAKGIKKKIQKGEVIGLDDVVVATSEDFNDLITKLKKYKFALSPNVEVIKSSRVTTEEDVKSL
jgi:hypothetical protein